MGYSTDFIGSIDFDKVVDNDTKLFISGLSSTRRVLRSVNLLAERLGISEEECLEKYGECGKHYFDLSGDSGQNMTDDILNFNCPPADQPGLWCDWCLGKDNKSIVWNQSEKFYEYIPWMKYLVKELAMRGYNLNGTIEWIGEEDDDRGFIEVVDNEVKVKVLVRSYEYI